MAALVSLSRGHFWRRGSSPPSPIFLNEDGCYWFLGPFFDDLALRTGRRIDLRGDSRFSGTHVTEFKAVIAQALATAHTRPPTFEVDRPDEDTPTTVDRETLIALLTSLDNLASFAQREHRAVVCEGEYALRAKGILTDAQKELRIRAAEAGERYVEGTLSYSEFRAAFDSDDDPLIDELTSLVEHQPQRGGFFGINQREYESYQLKIRRAILALRNSINRA